jgi:Lamin Tail Domain
LRVKVYFMLYKGFYLSYFLVIALGTNLQVLADSKVESVTPWISQINYATDSKAANCKDCNGYNKWIEIYNPSSTDLDLTGYKTSTGLKNQQSIKGLIIPAGGVGYLQSNLNKQNDLGVDNKTKATIGSVGSTDTGYKIDLIDANGKIVSSRQGDIGQTKGSLASVVFCTIQDSGQASQNKSQTLSNGTQLNYSLNQTPDQKKDCDKAVAPTSPITKSAPIINININNLTKPQPAESVVKETVKVTNPETAKNVEDVKAENKVGISFQPKIEPITNINSQPITNQIQPQNQTNPETKTEALASKVVEQTNPVTKPIIQTSNLVNSQPQNTNIIPQPQPIQQSKAIDNQIVEMNLKNVQPNIQPITITQTESQTKNLEIQNQIKSEIKPVQEIIKNQKSKQQVTKESTVNNNFETIAKAYFEPITNPKTPQINQTVRTQKVAKVTKNQPTNQIQINNLQPHTIQKEILTEPTFDYAKEITNFQQSQNKSQNVAVAQQNITQEPTKNINQFLPLQTNLGLLSLVTVSAYLINQFKKFRFGNIVSLSKLMNLLSK